MTLTRRAFFSQSLAPALLGLEFTRGLLPVSPQQASYDLLIRGARAIDPYQNLLARRDLAVQGDRIVELAENLPADRARRVIDADQLYLCPGWIDLHAHVFLGHHDIAVHPDRDAGVYTGVTTVVEAGGFEAPNVETFRREIVDRSETRVLGFINISVDRTPPLHGDWSRFDQKLTINTMLEHSDLIRGVKVMASNRHSANLGIVPTRLAVQAARETGTRVMAHIGMAPPTVQEVLDLLIEGDIVTHCFKGFPSGIFHRDGRPVQEVWEALGRGVRFDLGHGQLSFAWQAGWHARASGVPLHSCSTDLHERILKGPVWTFGRTMAKCLHLGYSLQEVVRTATLGPAELLDQGRELGSLLPGTVADITVFRLREAATDLVDAEGHREVGKWDVEPVHCIREGRVFSEMKIPPRHTPLSQAGIPSRAPRAGHLV